MARFRFRRQARQPDPADVAPSGGEPDDVSAISKRLATIGLAAEAAAAEIEGRIAAAGDDNAVRRQLFDALAIRATELQQEAQALSSLLDRAAATLEAAATPREAQTGTGSGPSSSTSRAPTVSAAAHPARPGDDLSKPPPREDPEAGSAGRSHGVAELVAGSSAIEAPAPFGSPIGPGIRLLITQMAVAGSPREDIARRLREDFALGGSESIVDAVLSSVGSGRH